MRVIVSGQVTADEVTEAIATYFDGPTTPNVLWDLRKADLSGLSAEAVAKVARQVAGQGDARAAGRTALVADGDLAFGLSRMYESTLRGASTARPTAIFRDMNEALAWLQA